MRVHSCFSLGYGILKPEELVAWALQHGHQQLLLTDINHTGSGLAFARAAQEQGLEPLLGLELRNGLQQVATIIARNNNGFQELNIGAYLKYENFTIGAWYRNRDAFIMTVGINTDKFKVGYSYDLTVSKLGNGISGGSHEISMGINLKCKKKPKNFRKTSCPSF